MAEDRDLGTQEAVEERSYARVSDVTGSNECVPVAPMVVSPDPFLPAVVPRSAASSSPVVAAELVLSKSDRFYMMAYARGGTMAAVGREWARLRRSRPYTSDDAASSAACRKNREVRRKIAESGDPSDYWELLGLTASVIAETLREGMKAVRRESVTRRRDKVIVTADGREKIVRDDAIEIVEVGKDYRSQIESAYRAAQIRQEVGSRRGSSEVEESHPRIMVTIRSFANVVNNMQANPQPALSAENPKEE